MTVQCPAPGRMSHAGARAKAARPILSSAPTISAAAPSWRPSMAARADENGRNQAILCLLRQNTESYNTPSLLYSMVL